MKLTIFERDFTFNSITFKKTEIECEGKGNKENPIIINSSTLMPNSFYIQNNNNQYIYIKNLEKNHICLEVCRNIKIENCILNYLEVYNSTDIMINNILVKRNFKLYYSQDNIIQNSNFNYLKLYHTKNNIIRLCKIGKIKNKLGKYNNFERNTLSEKQKTKLDTSPLSDFIDKWKLKYRIPFAICLLLSSYIIGSLLNLSFVFPTVLILYFGFEFSSITMQIIRERIRFQKKNSKNS